MKLYFLKQDALDTLRGNLKTNVRKYMNLTNEWVIDFFDGQSPFVQYKKEVNDFSLDMSFERPEESDVANIKILYSAMKKLTETDATDERIWSGLEHGQFWNYISYRWSLDKNTPTEREINSRFFYGQSKRRSLLVNTLSRLWWIGKLTYDEKRSNPFELTEVLSNDFATRTLMLFSSNYSSNPMIVRAILAAMLDAQKSGNNISRDIFTGITKYLNVLGGTYILDYFDEDVLKRKIVKEIYRLLGEKQIGSNNQGAENIKEKSEVSNKQTLHSAVVINNNVIQIKMSEIIIDEHKFNMTPYIGKVNALIEYYQKHKTLDKPIVVTKNEDKYLLEDKYLRYYVAKRLGLSTIDAIIEYSKTVS